MKTLNTTILLLALGLTACGHQQNAPQVVASNTGSKNLLIIGDSISMGYTTYVQKDLAGLYHVERVHFAPDVNNGMDENAQGTTHVLANLDRWLAQAPAHLDVITWNSGLWNARDPNLDPQAPGNATDLSTYQSELVQIATRLKATGARVIFFTTTDIPATGSTFIPGRDLDENAIANSVLPGMGIEVYDLNAMARSNSKLHLSTDPIHFNAQGYSLFGEYISDMVRTDYEFSN